ncbi:hypothetical protein D3C87_1509710 [compost metagenome]
MHDLVKNSLFAASRCIRQVGPFAHFSDVFNRITAALFVQHFGIHQQNICIAHQRKVNGIGQTNPVLCSRDPFPESDGLGTCAKNSIVGFAIYPRGAGIVEIHIIEINGLVYAGIIIAIGNFSFF